MGDCTHNPWEMVLQEEVVQIDEVDDAGPYD